MNKLPRPEFNSSTATYRMVVGKSGKAWFILTEVDNPGDYILVTDSDDWDKRGEGFGGSTLNLALENGEKFSLLGGWHSNSNALLRDTGIDLTHTHLTYGVITELDGTVVHKDEGWTLGKFDRTEELCKSLVEKSGKPLHHENQSMGGGLIHTIYPKNREEMEQ